jgi:cysteine desulfurase / selenocysteine lyase
MASVLVQSADASPPFVVDAIRRDFPVLGERVNGRRLVWLDNAATTQKPQAVIDRLGYFYAHENSNVHRGAHALAVPATDTYEAARATVAGLLGARSFSPGALPRRSTWSLRPGAAGTSAPVMRS